MGHQKEGALLRGQELRLGSLEERDDFSFIHGEFKGPVGNQLGMCGVQLTGSLYIQLWDHGPSDGN